MNYRTRYKFFVQLNIILSNYVRVFEDRSNKNSFDTLWKEYRSAVQNRKNSKRM